ncbi:MAG: OsmC family protein [Euryarchaeota archaeon]|nr:OsmC family protein [Euryarchaeota archaeon]
MYVFSSNVTWTEARRGKLACGNGFKATFSASPEFQGETGTLTAEDAFVASINMSFTLAFLKLAETEKVELREFDCSCNGIMDRVMPRMAFKRIVLHPRAVVASDEDVPKVERCMDLADKYAVVRNSVKPKVVLEYKIELDKRKAPLKAEQSG